MSLTPEQREELNKLTKEERIERRRQHWNAYMRQYNAKKREKQRKMLDEVCLEFNKSYKSYNKQDILEKLLNCIRIYTEVLNINIKAIPQRQLNKLIQLNNNDKDDIIEYITVLEESLDALLKNFR